MALASRPRFHWHHQWEAIDAHLARFTFVKGDGTAILYRCKKCNAVKSESINGFWTLDQVRGRGQ